MGEYSIEQALNIIDEPIELLEMCDFQNNEGHLVFIDMPLDEEQSLIMSHLERLNNYIKYNEYTSCEICYIKWDMRCPIETAQFIIKLSKRIVINVGIEFMDIIPWSYYGLLFNNYYLSNLEKNIILLKKENGGQLLKSKPDISSIGALYRWIDYNVRIKRLLANESEIASDIYHLGANYYHVRRFVYMIASKSTERDKRLNFITKYETNQMHIVDLYGDNYIFNKIYYDEIRTTQPQYYEKPDIFM